MSSEVTPLMSQYFAIRKEHPHALLLFQVGDFYELFFDDARIVSSTLALTLTKRGKYQGEDIPLCGIPVHVLSHYVAKLVKAGFSVAICDQVTKPVPGQVVKRAVTRVLTPGTLVDEGLLDDKNSSYLLSCAQRGDLVGMIFAELATGQLFATTLSSGDERSIDAELTKFFPDEVIVKKSDSAIHLQKSFKKNGYIAHHIDEDIFSLGCSDEWCGKTFGPETSQEFFKKRVLFDALDVLVRYLNKNNPVAFDALRQVHFYQNTDYLMLDAPTQKNLDLLVNAQRGGNDATLLSVVDRTKTPMGARLLKKWLVRPLVNKKQIVQRQQVVQAFLDNPSLLYEASQLLQELSDLERIVSRVVMGRATKSDFLGIKKFLQVSPRISTLLFPVACAVEMVQQLHSQLYVNDAFLSYLEASLSEELGAASLIKPGFDFELDQLKHRAENGNNEILKLENREIERTGIGSLKIRYTDVFGFGIEITKANYGQVPADFIPQQTLSNRTRYVTTELKELESEILDARQRTAEVELAVYQRVISEVVPHISALRISAQAVAVLDVLIGFAQLAFDRRYSRPEINEHGLIEIVGGRHPVVESVIHSMFVPNDTRLASDSLMHIVTGPNMGGKSTYLRQVALISILAHVGSFVPAAHANISILDRVFTRIGSGDDLAGGKSTFFVEMEETAIICQQATEKSLVILDEVGRGTSTYDGMALAHAILIYLTQELKVSGLFATHYHELCSLADEFSVIKNYSMQCRATAHGVVFLHKIIPQATRESLGVEIARQAGIPKKIVDDARAFLKVAHTQNQATNAFYGAEKLTSELKIQEDPCRKFIKDLDIEGLSARQALDVLYQLKNEIL
ncbi:DNA mismatch repair protein MutS [Candidatus Dependentiae bacterium]|nr:DNA mismatch repair protein MutS [Candidatus Dependentiae bacterium]